jgi:hypothetical protein
MRRSIVVLACCGLAFLGGCVPRITPGIDGASDYYAVTVSYNLSSVVVVTPVGDPESYEEVQPITAIISSGVDVVPQSITLEGGLLDSGLTVGATIVLSDDKTKILSLEVWRIKYSGFDSEWHRDDRIIATNIPLASPEPGQSDDVSVYRVNGSAACTAVTTLEYSNVRSPTSAVPESGPSYVVKDSSSQQCDEFSYLEITIEYVH